MVSSCCSARFASGQSHPRPPQSHILRIYLGVQSHPKATRSSSTTKKPELDSGLSATFYTENYFKSSLKGVVKGSVREIVMFSAGLFIPAPDGSQGHVSSHAEPLRDLPLSPECNVTRYFVGGVAVQVRAHSPCKCHASVSPHY